VVYARKQVSGRDGSVIAADLKALEARIAANSSVSGGGKQLLLALAASVRKEVENEDHLEKSLSGILQKAILFTTIFPLLVTLGGNLQGKFMAPDMGKLRLAPKSLSGQTAVRV